MYCCSWCFECEFCICEEVKVYSYNEICEVCKSLVCMCDIDINIKNYLVYKGV